MRKIREFFRDMLSENGKWSLSKVMTAIWFGLLLAYGIKFLWVFGIKLIAGEQIQMSEPVFLTSIFITLIGISFANKTALNLKAKSQFEAGKPETPKQETKDDSPTPPVS